MICALFPLVLLEHGTEVHTEGQREREGNPLGEQRLSDETAQEDVEFCEPNWMSFPKRAGIPNVRSVLKT
jgi:hypothetical protein